MGTWADALTAQGFNRYRPTTWVLEGFLPYLSAETERRLIATVAELSAIGSHIAYAILQDEEPPEVRNSSIHDDTEAKMGVRLSGLFSPEARPDAVRDLGATGWDFQRFGLSAHRAVRPRPEAGGGRRDIPWLVSDGRQLRRGTLRGRSAPTATPAGPAGCPVPCSAHGPSPARRTRQCAAQAPGPISLYAELEPR
ncbi:class I SAM-dependent methyltransferase [Streptomyces sp. NPDC057460]|uniref:class I SAM-dependent methyltransferase n=1 Tax=Streptomyces sp. NPDC057460 TaxID=3346141 RepID=UPI00369867B2